MKLKMTTPLMLMDEFQHIFAKKISLMAQCQNCYNGNTQQNMNPRSTDIEVSSHLSESFLEQSSTQKKGIPENMAVKIG